MSGAPPDPGALHQATEELPACGLFRTVFALPLAQGEVPASTLVYLHNHSAEGGPVIHLPVSMVDNRWTFGRDPVRVSDLAWVRSMVPLPNEGFYLLSGRVALGQGNALPEGLLVQLGYSKKGEPVAFPGMLSGGPAIHFERRGALLTDLQLAALRRADFKLLALPPQKAPPPAPPPEEKPMPDEWDA